MPLSFSTSLSGLTADSNAINDVSQNLANLNTTGYKDEQVSFEDLVNQSLSALSGSLPVSGSTIARTLPSSSRRAPCRRPVALTTQPYREAVSSC